MNLWNTLYIWRVWSLVCIKRKTWSKESVMEYVSFCVDFSWRHFVLTVSTGKLYRWVSESGCTWGDLWCYWIFYLCIRKHGSMFGIHNTTFAILCLFVHVCRPLCGCCFSSLLLFVLFLYCARRMHVLESKCALSVICYCYKFNRSVCKHADYFTPMLNSCPSTLIFGVKQCTPERWWKSYHWIG